jgi:hypothetical protein
VPPVSLQQRPLAAREVQEALEGTFVNVSVVVEIPARLSRRVCSGRTRGNELQEKREAANLKRSMAAQSNIHEE